MTSNNFMNEKIRKIDEKNSRKEVEIVIIRKFDKVIFVIKRITYS